MREVLALAGKDLRLLVRDKGGLFFTFFLPLIYCVFFGAIFSGMYGGDGLNALAIAVVDEDDTAGSKRFIQTLEDAPEVEVSLTDRETAMAAVRRGQRVAYVVIPKGFGERLDKPFWGGAPSLRTGIDPARQAEAGMLEGILTQYTYRAIQETMSNADTMHEQIREALTEVQQSKDMDPAERAMLQLFLPALDTFLTTLPQLDNANTQFGGFPQVEVNRDDVSFESATPMPTNSYQVSFPQGIIWGLIGCAAGFGLSLVIERTHGTLVRLRVAPISLAQVLAGKALACFGTALGVQVALFMLARAAFGVIPNSVPLLALALVCASLCFTGIMMLLSVLGKNEQSAGGIGWAVLLVMAMLGGGMIPLFIMPDWMQMLSHVSPVKWAVLSLEGAVWRGFSFGEMLIPCGILVGIGVFCFGIGVRAFGWTQKN